MTGTGGRPGATRAWLIRFTRFCLVGGVGFLVDAGLLLGLTGSGLLGPIGARALSFAAAVTLTYRLNRRWSFAARHGGPATAWPRFAAYLGVQGIGFVTNLSVYAAALYGLPSSLAGPLPCLALASATALAVNYVGADRLVFAERPPAGTGPAARGRPAGPDAGTERRARSGWPSSRTGG